MLTVKRMIHERCLFQRFEIKLFFCVLCAIDMRDLFYGEDKVTCN